MSRKSFPPSLSATLHDPFRTLGQHSEGDRIVLRLWAPHAERILLADEHAPRELEAIGNGLFELVLQELLDPAEALFEYHFENGQSWQAHSPWLFEPLLGEQDLHLFGEGRLFELWKVLGAEACQHQGVPGLRFAVWAPNARQVSVIGDFNGWSALSHPMRNRGGSGLWEFFLPDESAGSLYKFCITSQQGEVRVKADPLGRQFQLRPETACRVLAPSRYEWGDQEWLEERGKGDPLKKPLSVYEIHPGSWRRPWNPQEEGDWLNYRELGEQLADYLDQTGFTHVELMPVMEHPFDGSWGYQVTGYFAPSSRFGTPDDFRALVDTLHRRGYGVILDWVPAHFPKDDFALARFDGSPLYEHADPRLGEHPDWGTLIFNYGRTEVKNFLIANALYWIEEFHVDGIRVDAVASMLYLDYSREEGQWMPNRFGGRENLEAIDFLRELNTVLFERNPGILSIAEESTSWAGVSRPVYTGGLGFNLKWNMGWMHDSLKYIANDPVHRQYHHDLLTFSLVYAWTENFILVLSHDEVVHGKGSLLAKMPGDDWQKLANLRLFLAWMWLHPGAKLLFMGGELGQHSEWSEERDVDWRLQNHSSHRGIQQLLGELNHLLRREPALHATNHEPAGFEWSVVDDAAQSVFAFLRHAADSPSLLAVCNFTPVPRSGYELGVPSAGRWEYELNTDAEDFGGSGNGTQGEVLALEKACGRFPASLSLDLPPLGMVILRHESAGGAAR